MKSSIGVVFGIIAEWDKRLIDINYNQLGYIVFAIIRIVSILYYSVSDLFKAIFRKMKCAREKKTFFIIGK